MKILQEIFSTPTFKPDVGLYQRMLKCPSDYSISELKEMDKALSELDFTEVEAEKFISSTER